MTLVVARANDAGLAVVSDTRASFVSRDATRQRVGDRPASPLNGVLKAVILNHSQCVCFAGEVSVALDAILGIVADDSHARLDDELVLARLLAAHKQTGYAADFLLASIVGNPSLHEVKGGTVARNVPNSWLGNRDAFAAYQSVYHAPRDQAASDAKESARNELQRMSDAMLQLVESEQSFSDVGDFLICVRSRPHGLVYLPRFDASVPPRSISSTEWAAVEMGSAATGAYSYSVLCPTAAGVPLVAVYMAHGGFGAVFAPFHAREPVVIDANTPTSFVEQVERATGYELAGWVQVGNSLRRLKRHDPNI